MVTFGKPKPVIVIWCVCGGKRRGFAKDEKGWWVCSNCRKPSIHTLNECDDCGKLHRDGKQGFKFATTCGVCEDSYR